jgi:prepilin-type N-terminal cleavage/methylation domain-containing protein
MQFLAKKKKKGFTLIELLVVIAIIGILATIVIVNVNSARQKAKDTAVKGSLDSLRAAAELYYDSSSTYVSFCSGSTGGADFTRVNTTVANNNGSVNLYCQTSASAYAIFGYIQGTTNFYCIDSTGNAKSEAATSAVTACP